MVTVPFVAFGTTIQFSIALATSYPPPDGNLPDELAVYILDGTREPLFPTADDLGCGSVFAIALDGTPDGDPRVFAPATLNPGSQLIVVAAPERAGGPGSAGGACTPCAIPPCTGASATTSAGPPAAPSSTSTGAMGPLPEK
jgi:hypothetical protein